MKKEFQLVCAITELKGIKNEIEQLTARKKELESMLKAELTERETDTLQAGVFKVTWKSFMTHSFDEKGFKEDNPELFSKYYKEVPQKRFLVK